MTPKITATAILAIACSMATMLPVNAASTYQVLKPNTAIMQPNSQLRLAPLRVKCAAAGSPDFVNEGLLTNDGVRTIPAGTKLHWAMKDNIHSGDFTLANALAPNKATVFNLHFYTGAGAPCTATFVH